MNRPTALALVFTTGLVACAPATRTEDSGTDVIATSDSVDIALDGSDVTAEASDAGTSAPDCSFAVDASSSPEGGTVSGLRGERYCEVLLATLASGSLTVDVYNTEGLSDCPQEQWAALDPAVLRAQYMVTMAVLNGPRYWTVDAFANSMLVDPTVRFFGCIPMRLAGRITGTLAELMAAPYSPHTVMRNTNELFLSGTMVYELIDPSGHIYDMQSYSVQTTPQTEASLTTLGSRLTLPSGWMYRARMLTADLTVTAVGGMATVVQDDFKNTYQLSQQ